MLESLSDSLWTIRHRDAGVGGLGTRTTLVRLPDGAIWVHSPGPLTAFKAEIDALGPVLHLVAPNKIHNLYVPEAHALWPDATVWLAPGLRERMPALPAGNVLAEPSPWAPGIEHLWVHGVEPIEEFVFLHRPSRTLMLADLAFNVRPPAPWTTRLVMTLNGGFDRFGPSRAFRWVVMKDRSTLRRSLDAILAWDFDRIVVCHGDVVESGGKALFEREFSWV